MSTITPIRGVPIELDRTRYLRYSLGTLREIRAEFGAEALAKGIEDDAVAKFLWYGLRHEDAELTVEAVEEMVDLQNLPMVLDAVSEATGNKAAATTQEEAQSLAGRARSRNPPRAPGQKKTST